MAESENEHVPNLPVLVRLQKGKEDREVTLYDLCDVYIGPRIQNAYWQLPQSFWHNDFHFCKDQMHGLFEYRQHILGDVSEDQLASLMGKRLGCFCRDPQTCHGSVLIELVRDLIERKKSLPDSVHRIHADVVYFKGHLSPLSNLYGCTLQFQGRSFTSLEQIRLFMLCESDEHLSFLRETVLDANNDMRLVKVGRTVTRVLNRYRRQQQQQHTHPPFSFLVDMLSLMRLKMKQVPLFREFCLQNKNKFFVECTTSKFWGCGKDLTEISHHGTVEDMWALPGKNHLGWIILWALHDFLMNKGGGLRKLRSIQSGGRLMGIGLQGILKAAQLLDKRDSLAAE